MNIITVYGFRFALEGDGFIRNHAEQDFEIISDRIETKLRSMPAAEVYKLHSGSLMKGDGTPSDETSLHMLMALADAEAHEILKDWDNPSGAFVDLSATTL